MADLKAALDDKMLVCDGAMGTQLQARGLDAGAAPETWVLNRPEDVLAVHRDYAEAGADVILTCTFGGTRWRLSAAGLDNAVEEVNRVAAQLAREAAGDDGFVLGDVGPTGELVGPLGARDASEFEAVFSRQVSALIEGGVDGILIETMTAIEEAAAALKAARQVTDKPVFVSMQFQRDREGQAFHTVFGVDVAGAVRQLTEGGADGIGTNCVAGIEMAAKIVRQMRELTDIQIIAEPNAGQPRIEAGQTVYDQTPEMFASGAAGLAEAGANLIGGCCGTTPEHIRRLADALHRWEK